MRVGIVQTSNLEAKINEALHNANDRGETSVVFIVQSYALPQVVEFLRDREEVDVASIQNDSIFLIKHMRITFELVDYYV